MRIEFTRRFAKDFKKLSPEVRNKVNQVLAELPQHIKQQPASSGTRIKKMVNQPNIYEARIDIHYRITFQKNRHRLLLRRVGTHKIYKKP